MSIALPTKAMVLAAGLGTRMRPLTNAMPKPMVPLAGDTLIDRILDWLAASGIAEAVINTHYMADMLEAHLSRRSRPAIHISREDVLLETGGGIRKALPMLGSAPFFSLNSDTLCIDGPAPALARLAAEWDDTRMDALLLVQMVDKTIGYDGQGDFFVHTDGTLTRAKSRPAPYVFTGVQLLHPRLFEGSPDGPFSMNVLYNRGMAEDGTLSRVYALTHDGDWLHIGTPHELKTAEEWLARR